MAGSRTIWKYKLPTRPYIEARYIRYTRAASIRYIGLDPQGVPSIWIERQRSASISIVLTIQCIGTGHDVPEGMDYAGSCVVDMFVWHYYFAWSTLNV